MKNRVLILVLLIATSCRRTIQGGLSETPIIQSTQTLSSVQPYATPTGIQLPFNDKNVDNEYCQIPAVKLTTTEAQGLSEDQIAGRLMELLLVYFYVPEAPDYCRIDGYRIDSVYYDERTPNLPLEPKGDFARLVRFSVKLIQIPNMWMSWAGEIDQENWLHTGNNVAVFRYPDGYMMKFAYP
jgi:hypothetical protein